MESGDLNHLGAEYVVFNLMLHSASPHGRRLVDELYEGDPYNINIVLDSSAKNRSAEIANTYLKTMGLRLVFEKVYKELTQVITKRPVKFRYAEHEGALKEVVWFRPMDEATWPNYYEELAEKEKLKQAITKYPVRFRTVDHKGPDYPFED